MSGSLPNAAVREEHKAVSETLRKLADVVELMGRTNAAPHLRLVPGAEPEQPLDLDAAVALFPGLSLTSFKRFVKKHPEVVRRVGSRVFYERAALLRASARRG